MAAGRKVNPLTAAKKESTDARTTLKAMVNSYCDMPATKKAKAIAAQLEKVEAAEKTIREEKAASESLLFGSDGEEEEEEETEEKESEETSEEDSEEKEDEDSEEKEESKPVISRPVTARNQNRNK
jgi:hypothetical protein